MPVGGDQPPLPPGTILEGRYRVLRPLGEGGTGRIYEAEHTKTGARFALKMAEPEGAARLEQEAKATAMLKNPRAPRVVDLGRGPSAPYMVMELFVGQTLRQLLDEAGQLPLELVGNLVLQICECLAEAHALGLVHRDLKPDNVFLCPSAWPDQFDVKVLDFGIVKAVHEGALPKSELTRTGSTVGTPYYMSLEQLRNPSKVDARADVYSVGVMIYECLTGTKPFVADTIGDLVYVLCSGPPQSLDSLRPGLPIALSDMVGRMLSMKPEERPSSATEVALNLLPHANPVFGLWLDVGGRRPGVEAVRARLKGGAAPASVPERPAATTAVLGRIDLDEPRDTPTRMMFARPDAPGEVMLDRGRETPTEAIPAASPAELHAAMAARGMAMPGYPQTMPLPGPQLPGAPTFGVPVMPGPPKPKWQRTLEGWLEITGRWLEEGVRRFQRAQPPVKGAIVIGAAVLFLFVLIWLIRSLFR